MKKGDFHIISVSSKSPKVKGAHRASPLSLLHGWNRASSSDGVYRRKSTLDLFRCFLGRVEDGWAWFHSHKWSDWKKFDMMTSRSNRESFSLFLVSHLFLRKKRSKWFSPFFPRSRRSYTIGILRINWSTYRRDLCENLLSIYLPKS